jgi:alpha-glucuronidase
MQQTWNAQAGQVDPERFEQVKTFLAIQAKEARWWRNACVLYFQTFAKQPIPAGLEPPDHTLEYYISLNPRFVPGN